MAERWAVATGNWSNTATWNGGTLPGASDDVHANTYTVTIDQDVTVLSLRTTAGGTAIAGGAFNTSGTRTVTANSIAGTQTCLTLNSGGTQAGNSTGGSTNNMIGTVVNAGGIHNGNSTGGSGYYTYGSRINSGGIQNGNSTGGSQNTAYGTYVASGGIQNGNSTSGSVSGGTGTFATYGGIQNGNSTSGSVSGAYGTEIQGAIQNGNSTGGSVSGAYGTYLYNAGIQYGNATGGSASGAHGSYMDSRSYFFGGIATGNTSGANGVNATVGTNYSIVITQSEVGAYAVNVDATVERDNTNVPFYNPDAGGGGAAALVNGGLVQ